MATSGTTTGTAIGALGGLTAVATLDDYLGAHAYTAAQTALAVAWANDAIARYTERIFEETTYYEWHYAEGLSEIRLRHYPVDTTGYIARVCVGMTRCVSLVTHTAAGTPTYLQNTVSNGEFSQLTGVALGERQLDLTLATYATMSLFTVAINALAGGSQTATVLAEAKPAAIRPCVLTDLWPVGTIAYLEAPGTGIEVSADLRAGIIDLGSVYRDWIYVQYTGGFGTIPPELTQIATEMAAAVLRHDPSVKSERVGNTAFTYGEGDVMDAFIDRLGKWKRRSFL